MADPFAAATPDDVAMLVAEMPLCWIVPHAAPAAAILMPVTLEADGSFLGHLPRGAPATATLAADGRASFLFLGPNGYVAPAQAGVADWAPTWNFAAARFEVEIAVDPALTTAAVECIVATQEGPDGWTTDALGDRYGTLLARVIGFRAVVIATHPRFKLAQDETPAVRARIGAAHAGTPLGAWLRRFAERG